MKRTPASQNLERVLLAIVCSVLPYLIRKVSTEEASYLFCPRILAVEKPTRSKVVSLVLYRELLVRSDIPLWIVLSITQTHKNPFSCSVPQLACLKQQSSPSPQVAGVVCLLTKCHARYRST